MPVRILDKLVAGTGYVRNSAPFLSHERRAYAVALAMGHERSVACQRSASARSTSAPSTGPNRREYLSVKWF